MLVSAALAPPLTRIRPSASVVMPGQNMSWPVLDTSRSVEVDVAGSKVAVWV